jgi:molecular chaperone DnaK (HSP70)
MLMYTKSALGRESAVAVNKKGPPLLHNNNQYITLTPSVAAVSGQWHE